MSDLTPEDQSVLDDLAAAAAARRDVDPRHRDAAHGAFTWRTVDAELMELTYDSLDEPSAVRGSVGAQPRALAFSSRAGSLEVEVDGDRVRGHVVPARAVTVVMRNAAGEMAEANSDEDGMFVLLGTLPGPVRFHVRGDVSGTTSCVRL
jgi:hypothetical protein